MSDKTFLDTNIVVYLYSGRAGKAAAALALIGKQSVVALVLSELAIHWATSCLPFDV
jgi:predicted nucleic acid-binding protein